MRKGLYKLKPITTMLTVNTPNTRCCFFTVAITCYCSLRYIINLGSIHNGLEGEYSMPQPVGVHDNAKTVNNLQNLRQTHALLSHGMT